jgi:hypothetical protein
MDRFKIFEEANKYVKSGDYEAASTCFFKAADEFSKHEFYANEYANCFFQGAYYSIYYYSEREPNHEKLLTNIKTKEELLKDKIGVGTQINRPKYIEMYFNKIFKLLLKFGYVHEAQIIRKWELEFQLSSIKKWSSNIPIYYQYVSATLFDFGRSFPRFLVCITTIILFFTILFLFADSQHDWSNSLYSSILAFFGKPFMQKPNGWEKILISSKIFLGFVCLATLVKIFIRDWHGD